MNETWQHITEFEGLEVVDYQPGQGPGKCPRLFQLWADPLGEPEPPSTARKAAAVAVVALSLLGGLVWSWWALLVAFLVVPVLLEPQREMLDVDFVSEQWTAFLAEPDLSEVQALVFGCWFTEIDQGPHDLLDALEIHAPRFTNLRAIYFGDIVSEECEISWIEQGDLTRLLNAFPQLEVLVVRGGNGLRFEQLNHANLRKLTVQTGGMATETIYDLVTADLPNLEHLELWLGDPNYGFEAGVEDLRPLWQTSTFPRLTSLGLRNATISDDIALALASEGPALSRLDRLDLSLGTLSYLGAEALYNNPAVLQLESLDLHYNYLTEDWAEKLRSMPITVDVSDIQYPYEPEDEHDDERYVAVGE